MTFYPTAPFVSPTTFLSLDTVENTVFKFDLLSGNEYSIYFVGGKSGGTMIAA